METQKQLQEIIIDLRKMWRSGDIVERNGTSITEDGDIFDYYKSEDVLNNVDEFLIEDGYMLDRSMSVDDSGNNILSIRLITTDMEQPETLKEVSANLGSFSSKSDFGTRVTYCSKYLIGVLVGVAVDTDNDVYGDINDQKEEGREEQEQEKENKQQKEEREEGGQEQEEEVQRSTHFDKAMSLIKKAQKEDHYKSLKEKVENSSKIDDDEKEVLLAKINSNL